MIRNCPLFRQLVSPVVLLSLAVAVQAASRVQSAPVPTELKSSAYTVTVNGKPIDVAHAASNYDYVSFDIDGPVTVEVMAAEQHFWDRGVDIQPWRLGIHATREGQTIRFRIKSPVKLAISRPRDFLNQARMLFLFAGTRPPPPPPSGPGVEVYGPGLYKQSLTPKSGDTLYLSEGAYFLGSLNLFDVDNVRVLGRGTIVYEGPQNPNDDQGWMRKPDWHCVVASNAHHIEVDGLTCVIRSRTWSIQMTNSTGMVYDDLRVMGGNPLNANQDGMDWIGSSDGVVRNSFFRASDDVIALMGNWDGYTDADMLRPGRDVENILVENSFLSTSVSNIVRSNWPRKVFNSRNFTLRNSDILHTGIGACGQNFGLLGFWGADGAHGDHGHYTFENLFLDDWYSLAQIEQNEPAVHDFTFRNIWALDQPPLETSLLSGQISNVVFENVKYGQKVVVSDRDIPLKTDSAQAPKFASSAGAAAQFIFSPANFRPGQKVTFIAENARHVQYAWSFGDGQNARGRKVKHRFADSYGTQLDGTNGAGRFRIMLHTRDEQGHDDWAAQGVVAVSRWYDAGPAAGATAPGLDYKLYSGRWSELASFAGEQASAAGNTPDLSVDPLGIANYATIWDGLISIPADGGYTFHLMDRDGARLVIDGQEVAKTGSAFAQVCGSPGNAIRYDRGSIGLRAGGHTLHIEALNTSSQGAPRLLWEGPGLTLSEVPASAYSHPRADPFKAAAR